MTRLIDADALKMDLAVTPYNDIDDLTRTEQLIDEAPTVPLPDFKEGYKQAILDGKTNFSRPHGECKTCSHRDPEDKKCDCGGLERVGCQFPVSDDYYCKYYERRTWDAEEVDNDPN